MPLTEKGKKVMSSMKKQYGKKKGKSVFYASENKGVITGVHGSSKFNASDIKQGFKVCYDASDLDHMDDGMNAHMREMKKKMKHMEME
ncbi:MAG: hypothetical protein Q7J78_03520 [Clostridiales bacterium]|nr:hypothetical protein [Clostridiales bacterium]